jgi:hypothetical protein
MVRRVVSGASQIRPVRRAVPTYRPKNCTTAVWPGWTMVSEASTTTAAAPNSTPTSRKPVLASVAARTPNHAAPPPRIRAASTPRKPLAWNAGCSRTSTRIPW